MRATFWGDHIIVELELPEWADDQIRLWTFEDTPVIAHPEHPPHKWDFEKKVWVEIEFPTEVPPNWRSQMRYIRTNDLTFSRKPNKQQPDLDDCIMSVTFGEITHGTQYTISCETSLVESFDYGLKRLTHLIESQNGRYF